MSTSKILEALDEADSILGNCEVEYERSKKTRDAVFAAIQEVRKAREIVMNDDGSEE